MSLQELMFRYQSNIDKGKAAAQLGKIDEAKRYQAEAQKAFDAMELMKSFDTMSAALPVVEPAPLQRPALPGTTGASVASASNTPTVNPVVKAAYQMKFGETNDAVSQILTEINGADHEYKFHKQKQVFKSYLRYGERGLDNEGVRLLKQIILTPRMLTKSFVDSMESVDAMKATMVEGTDSLGGYTVPVDFQARVIEGIRGMTCVRGRAQEDSTNRDTVEMPTTTGGDNQYSSAVRVSWVSENPVLTAGETNLTFGLTQFNIYTVMAKTWLSKNLIEDAAFDIESYLTRKLAESSAIDEDNQFLSGSGTGTPQGILPGGLNTLSLGETLTVTVGAITWDSLISLYYSLPSQYRSNAAFIAENATFASIQKLKDASGNYLWTPFNIAGGTGLQEPRLLGKPLYEQEIMPSIATGAYPVLFGDLKGYQIFDRIGMSITRYDDSATAGLNTVAYMMRRRLGGKVSEPWRFKVLKVS